MNSVPPSPSRAYQRRDLWLLALMAFFTRALFVYRGGTPEPDSTAMMAGMAIAMSNSGGGLGDALLYGRHVNPGMHMLVSYAFPFLHISPAHVLPVLNWMTAVCASLLVIPLYTIVRPHLSHRTTMACLAVWLATPVVWESGTYYHPLIPAALLLLIALVCARHVAPTARGLGWGLLTVSLAAAAFTIRVELGVLWPAILFWTLTSRHRARNTGILAIVSACVAVSYLLIARSMAGATSTETLGVAGFLHLIGGMYSRTINLRGLPRSLVWMTLAVGIATLALCLVGFARAVGARQSPGVQRLVAAALLWSLPSILIWLPQPVPILRHYLLASVGLAAVLGALFLGRFGGRSLVTATVAVALLNIAVPEAAYRIYNRGAPEPKTPHGAFFYFHDQSSAMIAQNRKVARRILECGGTGGGGRSVSLVRWELFADVVYAAAVSGQRVEPESTESIFPGVRFVRLRVGEGEIRLIHYVYFEDDSLRTIVTGLMREARDSGYCLFAPRELCDRSPQLTTLGDSLNCY